MATDAKGNFTQGTCLFCVEPLPEVGRVKVIQYYNNLSDDVRHRVTPYSACELCYRNGLAKLDHIRAEYAKKELRTKLVYKHPRFVTERLTKYLESKGRKLPDDYKTYRSGGPRADCCLFCQDVPADYPVEVIYNDQFRTDTGTYACYECHQAIQKEVYDDMRGDTWAGFAGDAINRINAFIYKMEFDETVDEHYQHLIRDRDDEPNYNGPQGIFVEHCYFCKVMCRDSAKIIQVPVQISRKLTGGEVRCCQRCLSKIQRIRVTDPLVPNRNQLLEPEECDSCGADYTITVHEQRQRDMDGSVGKHMCPACAHKSVWEREYNEIFHVSNKEESRYRTHKCGYCDSPVLFDFTIPRRILQKRFISLENKVICSTCNYRGKFPIFVEYDAGSMQYIRYYQFSRGFVALIHTPTSNTQIETVGLDCRTPEEAPILLTRIRDGKIKK